MAAAVASTNSPSTPSSTIKRSRPVVVCGCSNLAVTINMRRAVRDQTDEQKRFCGDLMAFDDPPQGVGQLSDDEYEQNTAENKHSALERALWRHH